MHNFNLRFLGLALLSVFTLSACDTAQEQLGLVKKAPDEFKVVKRAPLAMPPEYELRPPAPGAPRPQEQTTVDQARQSVFGENASGQAAPSSSEEALLQQAGSSAIDPDIRRKVDKESAEMVDENQPVIDKILNIGRDEEPHATVLDAKEEYERLQKEGQAPNTDAPPSDGE